MAESSSRHTECCVYTRHWTLALALLLGRERDWGGERETRSQHTLGNDAIKERVTFIAVGAEVCIKDVALGRGEGEGARQ